MHWTLLKMSITQNFKKYKCDLTSNMSSGVPPQVTPRPQMEQKQSGRRIQATLSTPWSNSSPAGQSAHPSTLKDGKLLVTSSMCCSETLAISNWSNYLKSYVSCSVHNQLMFCTYYRKSWNSWVHLIRTYSCELPERAWHRFSPYMITVTSHDACAWIKSHYY